MSESSSPMEQFNINELAGATAIILTGISGILVVIFKSRCFCKFRLGVSDKYSLCMCERKPPPDTPIDDDEENKDGPDVPDPTKEKKPKETKPKETENLIPEKQQKKPDGVPETEEIITDNLV